MPATRTDDRGETLVEILVSIMILSIAAVAILTGLEIAIRASDTHRKQTTGGAYVRNYAEALEKWIAAADGNYQACPATNAYTPAALGWTFQLVPGSSTAKHWVDSSGVETIPTGYTPSVVSIQSFSATGALSGSCTADNGVEAVTLSVASADNRATEKMMVVIRRPCAGTGAPQCS